MGKLDPSCRLGSALTTTRSGGKPKAAPVKCVKCGGKGMVNINQMLGPNQVEAVVLPFLGVF